MEDFCQILGNNIRKYRLLKGWNQATLAKKSGIPQSTIAAIENGSATRVENFLKLSLILETPIENLVPKEYLLTKETPQLSVLSNISNYDLKSISSILNSKDMPLLKLLIPLKNIADEMSDEKRQELKELVFSILDSDQSKAN